MEQWTRKNLKAGDQNSWVAKGRELNSAATLASQRVACHSLSFIITIVIMTLGWGLSVELAAESCSRIWLSCLREQA